MKYEFRQKKLKLLKLDDKTLDRIEGKNLKVYDKVKESKLENRRKKEKLATKIEKLKK